MYIYIQIFKQTKYYQHQHQIYIYLCKHYKFISLQLIVLFIKFINPIVAFAFAILFALVFTKSLLSSESKKFFNFLYI